MTLELFRADAYQTEFEAVVVGYSGAQLELSQTCFCPALSAGFAADRGWVDQHEVQNVTHGSEDRIVHTLSDDSKPLPIGAVVHAKIDWLHRYKTMRLHSAFHLLEIGLRETNDVRSVAVTNTGCGNIDVAAQFRNEAVDLQAAQDWLARSVAEDLPMSSSQEPWPPNRWVWHLDCHGHRPCQALHVNSTGEIGLVTTHLGPTAERQVRLRLCLGDDDEDGEEQPRRS